MKIKSIAVIGALVAGVGISQGVMASSDCAACTKTESGEVRGVAEGSVISFKGIPYAAAPVGELRFRSPQPAGKWDGVLAADKFRSTCPQVKDPLEQYPFPGRVVRGPDGSEKEIYESEDCLHLNVWTPAADQKKRPIMVFLPGGAFVVGNGSSDFYNGNRLASQDVVVVTINYRVGLFGFMELGAISPEYAGSGNNGLLDQIAAIEWVKRNAASFGGDADNITVFGESAGGASVNALLATKEPSKLFKRAIAQSGAGNLIHSKRFALEAGKTIVGAGGFKSIDELLKATPEQLLVAQEKAFEEAAIGDLLFAPFVDGQVIIDEPNKALSTGNAKGIDLMAGATQNELNYWSLYDSKLRNMFTEETDFGPATPPIPEKYLASLEGRIGSKLDKRYAEILNTDDQNIIRQAQNDDYSMIQPMRRMAERQLSQHGNVYLYRFQWKVPTSYLPSGTPDLGAVHALELPFLFGTMDLAWVPGGDAVEKEQRAVDQKLSEQMIAAWTNFAKTGNPNGPNVPEWPKYDTSSRSTMVWSEASKAEADPESERRKIWAKEAFTSFL
ncbi:carboxylesterase family protein [Pseudomonas sp.]|uniref:carboxylesterase/lipase family protein n=1 Tax=Pseudomonas sp. TaxID=306 RepID=UPI0025EB571D|nr:carboxylesterase family protein [Pseudomonas sp.]